MDVKCVVVPGFKAAHLTTVGTPELNSSPKAPAASTAAADTDNVQEGDQTTQDVPGAAEAPEMDGYGPISAEHVRLLRPSVLRQILVDDLTGRPVAVDDRTSTVKPDPAAIRAQVLTMLRPQVVTDRAEPGHDPSARLARLVDILTSGCLVMIRLIPLVGTASCDADPPLRALLGVSEPDLATGADRWRVGVARATPVGPSAQSGSHDIHGTRRPGPRRPGQRR